MIQPMDIVSSTREGCCTCVESEPDHELGDDAIDAGGGEGPLMYIHFALFRNLQCDSNCGHVQSGFPYAYHASSS